MPVRRRCVLRPSPISTPFSLFESSTSSDELDTPLPQRPFRAPPRLRRSPRLHFTLVVVTIAGIGGLLHSGHVASLHENHLSFAYLSNSERELTFRSEMAFYYSFYKQILMAESFWTGLKSLFNDTVTEYPGILGKMEVAWKSEDWGVFPTSPTSKSAVESLRVLERFNIYPEVVLAGFYRSLEYLNFLHSECFEVAIQGVRKTHAMALPADQINANLSFLPPLEPIGTLTGDKVLSCEGSREPPIFYVNSVFSLTGFTVLGLVLSGWQVANCGSGGGCGGVCSTSSSSIAIWGAVLPLVSFFFNHGEATRVQWTPPLRESFAYPFFVLQQSLLIWLLRDILPSRRQSRRSFHYALYTFLLLAFQLPWQFAQFALLTQLVALMITYAIVTLLTTLPSSSPSTSSTASVRVVLLCSLVRRLLDVLGCQLVALFISWVVQFGNRLLLTSAYLPCLVGCFIGLFINWNLLKHRRWINSRGDRCVHLLILGSTSIAGMLFVCLLLRWLVLDFSDGAHIVDLLEVKLLRGNCTFHTQLYTCSEAFDYLPMSTWINLGRTGLLPGAIFAVLVTLRQVLLPLRSENAIFTSATNAHKEMTPGKAGNKKSRKKEIKEDSDSEASDGDVGGSTVSTKSRCLQEQILLARSAPILIADVVSVFVVVQLFLFAALAVLVMRLKLFFTPQLCLSLAILAQPRLYFGSYKILPQTLPSNQAQRVRQKRRGDHHHHHSTTAYVPSWRRLLLLHTCFTVAMAVSAQRGVHNLKEQWSNQGQFSDFNMETLLQWANRLPPPKPPHGELWVLTGAMPTMATLRLGLVVPSLPSSVRSVEGEPGRRPRFALTNHPHYENAAIRWRTEFAYAVCSRKPPEAVWRIYRHVLQADFIVIERGWCLSPGAKSGCSSVELWDLLDPSLADRGSRGPLCAAAFQESPLPKSLLRFFIPVFRSIDQSLVVWRVAP